MKRSHLLVIGVLICGSVAHAATLEWTKNVGQRRLVLDESDKDHLKLTISGFSMDSAYVVSDVQKQSASHVWQVVVHTILTKAGLSSLGVKEKRTGSFSVVIPLESRQQEVRFGDLREVIWPEKRR